MPRSAPSSAEFDVAEGVYARVKEPADDGGGLVFGDDSGTRDHRTGQEIAALVDSDVDELAGVRVEDRASARGLRRMRLGCGQWSGRFGGNGRRQEQHPAENLDLHTRNDPAVETAVGLLEGVVKDRRVGA